MIDSRKIEDLHPELQWRAEALIELCAEEGFEIRVISTFRDAEFQNHLYAQGRTRPGDVVTWVVGGYSNHNYRRAFDIGVFVNGKYMREHPGYNKVGPLGESLGLAWGGRWRKPDRPHFEFMEGYTTADFREGRVSW